MREKVECPHCGSDQTVKHWSGADDWVCADCWLTHTTEDRRRKLASLEYEQMTTDDWLKLL